MSWSICVRTGSDERMSVERVDTALVTAACQDSQALHLASARHVDAVLMHPPIQGCPGNAQRLGSGGGFPAVADQGVEQRLAFRARAAINGGAIKSVIPQLLG